MDNKKVGELIASLRKKKGLTQEQLGELVGVGYGAVSKWERGVNTPDKSIINQLSEILGISSTELLNGEIKEEEILDVSDSNENITNEDVIEEKLEKDSKKKSNSLKYILIVLFIIIGVIISIVFIYNNNNKTYAYNLLSTSDDYYVEGKAIFKGDELSLVVNKIKFKNDEFNSTIIKNYEYIVHSNDVTIFKRGYIYLTNQLDNEIPINEFTKKFNINHNGKTVIKRQEIIDNNLFITLKFLNYNDDLITKDIKIKLSDTKYYKNDV